MSWPPSTTWSGRCASIPGRRRCRGRHGSTKTSTTPATTRPRSPPTSKLRRKPPWSSPPCALRTAAVRRPSTCGGARSTWPSACSPAYQPTPPSNDYIMRNSANAEQIEINGGPAITATRTPPSSCCVLLPRRLRSGHPRTGGRPMGHRPWRIPLGLGRRTQRTQPATGRPGLRALRHPARLPGLWLGSRPRRQRRRNPAAPHLALRVSRRRVRLMFDYRAGAGPSTRTRRGRSLEPWSRTPNRRRDCRRRRCARSSTATWATASPAIPPVCTGVCRRAT